jgi:hypothetical protein
MNNKGRSPLQKYYWSGAGRTFALKKERRLSNKYPFYSFLSKKLTLPLQIDIMLNTSFVVR